MDVQMVFVALCVALALAFMGRKVWRTLKGNARCDGCKASASSCESCQAAGRIADFRSKK